MAFTSNPPMPRSRHRAWLILGFLLLFGGAMEANTDPIAKLDQKAVHDDYVNGNFEMVVEKIGAFQKETPLHSRDDSIFIARHLGVVHAADPKSVEAGKYWMHRLILLSPAADLSGMYVSEEIDRLFERVRQEAGIRPGGRAGRKWVWLAAGGTALAVVVTALMLSDGGSDDSGAKVDVDL